jgi:hypothetical protein
MTQRPAHLAPARAQPTHERPDGLLHSEAMNEQRKRLLDGIKRYGLEDFTNDTPSLRHKKHRKGAKAVRHKRQLDRGIHSASPDRLARTRA